MHAGGEVDELRLGDEVTEGVAREEERVAAVGTQVDVADGGEQRVAGAVENRALSGLDGEASAAAAARTGTGEGDGGAVRRNSGSGEVVEVGDGPANGVAGVLRAE